MGDIVYFCIDEWNISMQYKHSVGIVDIYVDPAGTRLIFIDTKKQGFVFNAVSLITTSKYKIIYSILY